MKSSRADDFQQSALKAAHLLKTMSNPNRLMILCSLAEGEHSVNALNERIPLSQSSLSQHLAVLREASLVTTKKEGTTVYYNLFGGAAIQIIQVLKSIYCPDSQ